MRPHLPTRARTDPVTLTVGSALTILALAFILVPLTLPAGSVDLGDGGTTIPGEFDEVTEGMRPVQRALYRFGDATCHQKSSRSYFLNGNQMPLCARCIAIYLGMGVATLFAAFFSFRLEWWHFIVFLAPMAVDGGGQTILCLWESTNPLRLITGGLAGWVTGAALGYIIRELRDVMPGAS